jgi:hypothetical protein
MTEYEIVDITISFSTAGMTSIALYLTAVSGYLVAALVFAAPRAIGPGVS